MLDPYSKAEQMYIQRGYTAADLAAETIYYARSGYVHATPLEFALARPIDSSGGKLTEDPQYSEGLTIHADCWNIHVVVGDLRDLLDNLPYHLPFICFQRKSGFKIYPYSRIDEITKNANSAKGYSSRPPSR